MIDIQQRALGALEQDVPAPGLDIIEDFRDIGDQRHQGLGRRHGLVQQLLKIQRRAFVIFFKYEIVVIQHFAQFGGESFPVQQVAHAQGAPCHLVFVSGADATACGTYRRLAAGLFPRLVQGDMVGQD